MTQVFLSYLILSLIGTVSALIFLLIRPITKKCFSASWHYYSWFVVLLVMLVPLRVDIQNINLSESKNADTAIEIIANIFQEDVISENENIETEEVRQQSFFEICSSAIRKNINIFAFVWFFGVIFFFAQKMIRHHFFLKLVLKKSRKIQVEGVGENIEVRVMEDVKSPFVVKCVNPILILPDKELVKDKIQNVLAHELIHIKRLDILYKWVVIACKAVHWFNPFMYLIARYIEKDCEISCDETAVKNMNNEEKKTYADTILSFAFEYGRTYPLTTSISSNKRILKNRLIAVKNSKKKSKINIVISIVALFAMLVNFIVVSACAGGIFLPENYSDAASENIRGDLDKNEIPERFEENGLYGYKSADGNVIVPPKYVKAWQFFEGAALVVLPEDPYRLRYIDTNGDYLFEKTFCAANDFHYGYALALVGTGPKYSYIDKTGEFATKLRFDDAEDFSTGFARVQLNEKWGIVDTNFDFVVPCEYEKDEVLSKLN